MKNSVQHYQPIRQRAYASVLLALTLGMSSYSFAANNTSQIPTAVPTAPSIDWMPEQWSAGQKIPVGWHLYWGTPGTSWELLANNQSVLKSTTFESTTANTQSAKAETTLNDGRYSLIVKLCNAEGCASSASTQIVVGPDADKAPTAPSVNYIGNIAQGNAIPIKWNMWWGTTGKSWEVWIDGTRYHTSQQFTVNTAYTQAGEAVLNSTTLKLANGSHSVKVKLCNGTKCGEGAGSFTLSGSTPTPTPEKPGKPVIASIPDSTTGQVSLAWKMSTGAKGATWSATDNFNGNTSTVYPSSSVFSASDPVGTQSGNAMLALQEGTHNLVVQLCNTQSVCTSSDPVVVRVTVPAPPTPGVAVLDPIANSTSGKFTVKWKTTGKGGAYWEVLNNANTLQRFTQFSDATNTSGTQDISVANGTYSVTIKLCNASNVCTLSNQQVATVSGASAQQHFFIAYYPTWFAPYHNAFCDSGARYYDYDTKTWVDCVPGAVLPDKTISSSSLLAGGVPNYVTHVVLAFAKLNTMRNYPGLSVKDGDLKALGLDLNTSSASLKESIRVLKKNNPGTKVILALGGATFNASWQNVTDADINGAAKLIVDLGLDGLDVDYEVSGTTNAVIDEYYNSIVAMRKAVDKANESKTDGRAILTVPGWSTGADCTPQTQGAAHPACTPTKVSYFGGNAGRERLVFEKKGAASMFDIVAIMSYDAGYEHFDPVTAYTNYKQIVKPGTPIAIGIQPSPDEGWGGARTLVNERGINNDCVGNTILADQYSVKTPGTFSVQRFAELVKRTPGDGMMMWSLFSSRAAMMCGSVKLSTVTELGQGVSQYLGIGNDRTKQIDYNTAISYGSR